MRLCRQRCSRCFLVLAVFAVTAVSASEQGPVKFVMHRVGQFRSEACNVGDFNNDGKLDIVAGPYWYEAPDWKAHKFRELRGDVNAKGEGYYDDYMNAQLDVDGDGLLDVIRSCRFAKRMEWYRNTGPGGGEWPMAVGEENGTRQSNSQLPS